MHRPRPASHGIEPALPPHVSSGRKKAQSARNAKIVHVQERCPGLVERRSRRRLPAREGYTFGIAAVRRRSYLSNRLSLRYLPPREKSSRALNPLIAFLGRS